VGQLLPAPPSVSASAIVAIARVLRAHGIHGEFKVQILCSGPEHFLECVDTGEVLLQREGLPGAFLAPVKSVRPIPEGALVSIEGIETREAVEALRGAILGLPEDRLPACEPDTYYHHQLEGLRVVAAGDHAEIGMVVRVEDSPGHDQLVVRPKAEAGPREAPGDGLVDQVDDAGRVDSADEGDVVAAENDRAVLPDESTKPAAFTGSTPCTESTKSTEPPAPRPRRGPRKKAGDRPKSRDFLIPFVGAFVARVDLAAGCIEVTLPPGFVESQR
jgi:16S rRNA processing protein RimM